MIIVITVWLFVLLMRQRRLIEYVIASYFVCWLLVWSRCWSAVILVIRRAQCLEWNTVAIFYGCQWVTQGGVLSPILYLLYWWAFGQIIKVWCWLLFWFFLCWGSCICIWSCITRSHSLCYAAPACHNVITMQRNSVLSSMRRNRSG